MGITGLLDHTANYWRLTETKGTEFRETIQTLVQVNADPIPCTFQRRDTLLGQQGPGLRAIGDRRVYFDTGPLFEDRDVIELVSGPTGFVGPQLLEVESIAIPRGHHIELRCTEFKGELPPDAS